MATVDAGDYATGSGTNHPQRGRGSRYLRRQQYNPRILGRLVRSIGTVLATECQEWIERFPKSWSGLMAEPNFRILPPKLLIRWKPLLGFTLHTPTMRRGRNFRCRVQTVSTKSTVGNDARNILDFVINARQRRTMAVRMRPTKVQNRAKF